MEHLSRLKPNRELDKGLYKRNFVGKSFFLRPLKSVKCVTCVITHLLIFIK